MFKTFTTTATLGQYQPVVDHALGDLKAQRTVQRIWEHDHTVWRPDPDEITNRLGWLHAPAWAQQHLPRLETLVSTARAEGYTHVLWLGMGGSSLAADVFRRTFGTMADFLEVSVLDSTDPEAVLCYANHLDLRRTLFVVATKSGGTAETLSFFKYFYNRTATALGEERAGEHFIAITDPGSKLAVMAEDLNFRETLLNDPNIGGRFSALSYFGITATMFLGMDTEVLVARAAKMAEACGPNVSAEENPGAWLGAVLGELAKTGRDKLTLITSPAIASFGDWVEQLIAESTGKDGRGILPVVGEAVGAPDDYMDDRFFVYLKLAGDSAFDDDVQALANAGHPVVRFELGDLYDLGGQFFLWEMATAVAGQRLGIQPYNQPNVEAAKRIARDMIKAYQEQGSLPEGETAPTTAAALHDFLAQGQPGDYIAIQAYVTPTKATDVALHEFRTRLRGRTKMAVTVGYGPRFLHSTGQLHKGDAGNGLFIQLTADTTHDAPIPDAPGAPESNISFGVLKMAQALGDYQALLDAKRRVIHFHLNSDVIAGIEKLST